MKESDLKIIEKSLSSRSEEFWEGFELACQMLDDMGFTNTSTHPYNIADCLRRKWNRLPQNKIRKTKYSGNAFFVNPELPLNTKFWIMKDNHIVQGLICQYNLNVTSCADKQNNWYAKLFSSWNKGNHNGLWNYLYSYNIKLNDVRVDDRIEKRNGQWWISNQRVYFSIDELKSSL